MERVWISGILAAVLIFLVGCSGQDDKISNLRPIYLEQEPSIRVYSHPAYDLSQYRTFAIIPASRVTAEARLQGIEEIQILFFLRNVLEQMGFLMVDAAESADLIFVLDGHSEYKESYVPPETVTTPIWVPGRTVTTHQDGGGRLNLGSIWGSWSEYSTSQTYIPGHFESRTFTRPGYSIGAYYPSVAIFVLDGASREIVWQGIAAGTSNNSDFRVSSQLLIENMLFNHFPVTRHGQQTWPRLEGGIPGEFGIYTVDGNNFFPAFRDAQPGSFLAAHGIKREDIIISVNGQPTRNRSYVDLLEMMWMMPGDNLALTIWRTGEVFDVTMKSPN